MKLLHNKLTFKAVFKYFGTAESESDIIDPRQTRVNIPRRAEGFSSGRSKPPLEVASPDHASREPFSHVFGAGARDRSDQLIGASPLTMQRV
jgi:hypothetical protein